MSHTSTPNTLGSSEDVEALRQLPYMQVILGEYKYKVEIVSQDVFANIRMLFDKWTKSKVQSTEAFNQREILRSLRVNLLGNGKMLREILEINEKVQQNIAKYKEIIQDKEDNSTDKVNISKNYKKLIEGLSKKLQLKKDIFKNSDRFIKDQVNLNSIDSISKWLEIYQEKKEKEVYLAMSEEQIKYERHSTEAKKYFSEFLTLVRKQLRKIRFTLHPDKLKRSLTNDEHSLFDDITKVSERLDCEENFCTFFNLDLKDEGSQPKNINNFNVLYDPMNSSRSDQKAPGFKPTDVQERLIKKQAKNEKEEIGGGIPQAPTSTLRIENAVPNQCKVPYLQNDYTLEWNCSSTDINKYELQFSLNYADENSWYIKYQGGNDYYISEESLRNQGEKIYMRVRAFNEYGCGLWSVVGMLNNTVSKSEEEKFQRLEERFNNSYTSLNKLYSQLQATEDLKNDEILSKLSPLVASTDTKLNNVLVAHNYRSVDDNLAVGDGYLERHPKLARKLKQCSQLIRNCRSYQQSILQNKSKKMQWNNQRKGRLYTIDQIRNLLETVVISGQEEELLLKWLQSHDQDNNEAQQLQRNSVYQSLVKFAEAFSTLTEDGSFDGAVDQSFLEDCACRRRLIKVLDACVYETEQGFFSNHNIAHLQTCIKKLSQLDKHCESLIKEQQQKEQLVEERRLKKLEQEAREEEEAYRDYMRQFTLHEQKRQQQQQQQKVEAPLYARSALTASLTNADAETEMTNVDSLFSPISRQAPPGFGMGNSLFGAFNQADSAAPEAPTMTAGAFDVDSFFGDGGGGGGERKPAPIKPEASRMTDAASNQFDSLFSPVGGSLFNNTSPTTNGSSNGNGNSSSFFASSNTSPVYLNTSPVDQVSQARTLFGQQQLSRSDSDSRNRNHSSLFAGGQESDSMVADRFNSLFGGGGNRLPSVQLPVEPTATPFNLITSPINLGAVNNNNNNNDNGSSKQPQQPALCEASSEQFRQFLVSLGLEQYLARFVDEDCADLHTAALLTEDDLASLGIKLGPRKKLFTALQNWNSSNMLAAQSPPPLFDSFAAAGAPPGVW